MANGSGEKKAKANNKIHITTNENGINHNSKKVLKPQGISIQSQNLVNNQQELQNQIDIQKLKTEQRNQRNKRN